MVIAAVPAYLGNNFKDASPGMRFGMYLPIWTERADQEADVKKRAEAKSREGDEVQELLMRGMDHAIQQLRQRESKGLPSLWDKNDFAAKQSWKQVIALSRLDKNTVVGLLDRQRQLAVVSGDALFALEARAVAPFTTGLGNEHPLENGFAFLNPYGLPYLPGSGVKGVLRQAARELASGEWGEMHGWSEEKSYTLQAGRERIALSALDALFGLESGDGDTEHVRGALTFWDVIPQIKGDSLMVEIMTPHQSHYYQQKRDRKAGNSDTPHDSGQPNPISFVTVPPGSGFVFHVQCDLAHLNRIAPELAAGGQWKALLAVAFEHAFQWLGFGAKTAVGYGAMTQKSKPGKPTGPSGGKSPEGFPATEQVWKNVTLKLDTGGGGRVMAVTDGKRVAELSGNDAIRFLEGLSVEQRERLKKKKEIKPVSVVVEEKGNMVTLKRLV